MEEIKLFEDFCKRYHLEYNFKKKNEEYESEETQKAFIIFRYK